MIKKFTRPALFTACAAFILLGTAASGALASAGGISPNGDTARDADMVVTLYNNDGAETGTAELFNGAAGVLFRLHVHGLPPGERAFHIHEKGDCTPLESFMNTGGHFNPHGTAHGFAHEGGAHAGDMPNIIIGEDGTVSVEILNPHVTLDPNDPAGRPYLLAGEGTALVMHAGPDDHMSQPAGAAGDRILCGEIVASPAED